jgi:hypothetical protein
VSDSEPTANELLNARAEYDTSKPKSLEQWAGWRLFIAPTGELETTESTIAGVMDDCSFARRARLMRLLKPHDGADEVKIDGGRYRVRLPKVEVFCPKCDTWIRLLDMNQHLRRGKCRHLLTIEDQAIRAAERYRAPGDMSPYLNAEWRKAFIESLKTQGCNPPMGMTSTWCPACACRTLSSTAWSRDSRARCSPWTPCDLITTQTLSSAFIATCVVDGRPRLTQTS